MSNTHIVFVPLNDYKSTKFHEYQLKIIFQERKH